MSAFKPKPNKPIKGLHRKSAADIEKEFYDALAFIPARTKWEPDELDDIMAIVRAKTQTNKGA